MPTSMKYCQKIVTFQYFAQHMSVEWQVI